MIQHVWTVPCRVSIVDTSSNNVSLIEVIEEIEVAFDPSGSQGKNRTPAPFVFDLVTLWTRGDSKVPEMGYGQIAFTSPTNEVLVQSTFDVDLKEAIRTRTSGKFLGLSVQQSGLYHFVISRRAMQGEPWEDVAWVPLAVQLEQPDSGPAQNPTVRSA